MVTMDIGGGRGEPSKHLTQATKRIHEWIVFEGMERLKKREIEKEKRSQASGLRGAERNEDATIAESVVR